VMHIRFSCLVSLLMISCPPTSTLFPYTTLFRSALGGRGFAPSFFSPGLACRADCWSALGACPSGLAPLLRRPPRWRRRDLPTPRSEEHTSELQSRFDLVCRLLLEKKKHNIVQTQ